MIKAVEANEKARAYIDKFIAECRAKAVVWVENKIAPIIKEEAEKGMYFTVVRMPNDIEWAYVREYLKEHGYDTKYLSFGEYQILW